MKVKRKLLILGLDGATWSVLLPFVRGGQMPTLKKIVNEGVWGHLKSTIPPVTGPSWTSFAMGKNPGKTGVYDFFIKEPKKYMLKPVSSVNLKGHAFWDFLSNEGYRVGVVTFPMLYPPYRVNGFMLSGVSAPKESNICFPTELNNELKQKFGFLATSVGYHHTKYDDEELFLKDLNKFVDKQTKIVKYLMIEKKWDLFLYVFSATDWIQHLMWKHIDEEHPLYDPERSHMFQERFIQFFREIDYFLREVLYLVGNRTNIMILSDHGFGIQDQCFNLARWLKDKGYLKTKSTKKMKADTKKRLLGRLSSINKALKLKKLFPKGTTKKITEKLRTTVADSINFNSSEAYCLGHTIPFGAIYINLKGRDPKGTVRPEDYAKLKSQIINDLHKLTAKTEEKLNVEVYDPQKIYNIRNMDLAPDIIFTVNNWRCVILENDFNRPLFEEKPFSNRHTGSHRMNGIFLAYGPDIKEGFEARDSRIIDIAPTILHMFNAPIPKDVDGRVLTEIFEPQSEITKRPPVYVDTRYYEKKPLEDLTKANIKKLKRLGRI